MSILLLGARRDVGEAVVTRLVGRGDEVRVVEPDASAADRWRALGAYVAIGSPDDADLVERAAQNVRTAVVFGDVDRGPILQGIGAAGVGRVVLCLDRYDAHAAEGEVELVALLVPRTRFPRRPTVSPEAIAEAVDAADDLAGNPRMVVDLGDAQAWRALGLESPET